LSSPTRPGTFKQAFPAFAKRPGAPSPPETNTSPGWLALEPVTPAPPTGAIKLGRQHFHDKWPWRWAPPPVMKIGQKPIAHSLLPIAPIFTINGHGKGSRPLDKIGLYPLPTAHYFHDKRQKGRMPFNAASGLFVKPTYATTAIDGSPSMAGHWGSATRS